MNRINTFKLGHIFKKPSFAIEDELRWARITRIVGPLAHCVRLPEFYTEYIVHQLLTTVNKV